MRSIPTYSILCIVVLVTSLMTDSRAQAPRTMSFQGYLTDSGDVPIDGLETIDVKLFDAPSGGTQVWSRTYTDHPVNAGIFNMVFEAGSPTFSSLAFNDSSWVQVEAGAEVLTPRTALTAAPFAMGLSIPIRAEGNAGGFLDAALKVTNTATTQRNIGVWGKSNSTNGRGVFGWAAATSGSTIGVIGQTSSSTGWGGFFAGGQGTYTVGEDNSAPDLVLGGASDIASSGRIFSDMDYPGSDIYIQSNDFVTIQLDRDGSGEDADFYVADKDNNWLFNIDESGALALRNAAGTTLFQVDTTGTVKVKGTIVHPSDRNRKDNIVPANTGQILDKVARMPINQWRYKGNPDTHVGPMAQDFYSAFNLGSDDTGIATVDADGVALAAIQGLYELVQEQGLMLAAQQEEIERMKAVVGRR